MILLIIISNAIHKIRSMNTFVYRSFRTSKLHVHTLQIHVSTTSSKLQRCLKQKNDHRPSVKSKTKHHALEALTAVLCRTIAFHHSVIRNDIHQLLLLSAPPKLGKISWFFWCSSLVSPVCHFVISAFLLEIHGNITERGVMCCSKRRFGQNAQIGFDLRGYVWFWESYPPFLHVGEYLPTFSPWMWPFFI